MDFHTIRSAGFYTSEPVGTVLVDSLGQMSQLEPSPLTRDSESEEKR